MLDGAKPDFRETFDTKQLDTALWNVARSGKTVVRRGRLVLKGTTRLDTRGLWDLQYGTITVRARICSRNPELIAHTTDLHFIIAPNCAVHQQAIGLSHHVGNCIIHFS